jgi:hypothetical protein
MHDTEDELALEGDDEEDEEVSRRGSATPTTGLKRARQSYVKLQHSLLREYEEVLEKSKKNIF